MSNIVTITSNDTLEVAYTKKLTVLLHTLKKTTVKIPYVDCWLCEHCLEQGDDCYGGTQALQLEGFSLLLAY